MLGILDSGLGGLTVLQRIHAKFPEEGVIYFADQASSPLGVRPSAELSQLFQRYVNQLQDLGVDGIVMGSNTLCAIARDHGWPSSKVPIIDLIEPTARAVAASGEKSIGVLATSATVLSGVYGDAIRAAMPGANVQEVAASELVGYVEAGITGGEQIMASLRTAYSKFSGALDLLVLGCTHFPWLNQAISEVFDGGVKLLDPADSVVSEVVALRAKAPESMTKSRGGTRFITTGDARLFEHHIERLIGPLNAADVVIPIDANRSLTSPPRPNHIIS